MDEARASDAPKGADGTGEAKLEADPGRQPGFLARFLGLAQTPAPAPHLTVGPEGAEGEATAAERALLSNIQTMRDQRVDDIMIPRADIVSIAEDADLAELTNAFREGAHSRMPVFRDTLDDPVGFIHVKDVALARGFGAMSKGAADGAFRISDFMRQILVVPPSMLTRRLLQRMQKNRIHMALVVDEYGGVDGLVTIEDVVEQIVGDIEDEHDEAEVAPWRREAPGVYVANARAELAAFETEAGLDLLPDDLDEDVDTLGGLVFMLSNRVPERGEVVIHPQGHEFEVIDADPRRIKRLRVSLYSGEAAAAAE
ncbi:MAG: hemolysin family protein [Pseudomonadota bacterium]